MNESSPLTALIPMLAITASVAIYGLYILITKHEVIRNHWIVGAGLLGTLWSGYAISIIKAKLTASTLEFLVVFILLVLVFAATLIGLAVYIYNETRTITKVDLQLLRHSTRILGIHVPVALIAALVYQLQGGQEWWKFAFLLSIPFMTAGFITAVYSWRR